VALVSGWTTPFFGTEINYLFLPNVSNKYRVSSDGSLTSPFLLVPFYNVVTQAEDSTALHLSFDVSGTAELKLVNMMQGAEWNGLASINTGCL